MRQCILSFERLYTKIVRAAAFRESECEMMFIFLFIFIDTSHLIAAERRVMECFFLLCRKLLRSGELLRQYCVNEDVLVASGCNQ